MSTKKCSMCGKTFMCGGLLLCWCAFVPLSGPRRKDLSYEVQGCVCPNCLKN